MSQGLLYPKELTLGAIATFYSSSIRQRTIFLVPYLSASITLLKGAAKLIIKINLANFF